MLDECVELGNNGVIVLGSSPWRCLAQVQVFHVEEGTDAKSDA